MSEIDVGPRNGVDGKPAIALCLIAKSCLTGLTLAFILAR
jgi:hypothetical protein